MHYFITGASGFIGKSTVKELIAHNHTVTGLVRSDAGAVAITALGAKALRGDIEDLPTLTAGAAASDGVVHLAFKADFSDLPGCIAADKAAIQALADGLAGSGKPLVVASGTLVATKGVLGTEDSEAGGGFMPFALRAESADLLVKLSQEKNVRGAVVRFSPTVHGEGDGGFIPMAIAAARKAGVVPIVAGRQDRWPAVHKDDLAVLLRLIVEKGRSGATYNGVAEFDVPIKRILEMVAKKTGLPLEEVDQGKFMEILGFVGTPLTSDNPTSSEKTQKELGWTPTNAKLIEDMEACYF